MNSTPKCRSAGVNEAGAASAARTARRPWRGAAVVAALMALLGGGCSASSGVGSEATAGAGGNSVAGTASGDTGSNTTYGGDTAGTVTVSTSTITGQEGRMLLIFATSEIEGAQAGVACVQITSGSFAMPSTMLTVVPDGQNPCAGGTPVAVLADGAYTLTAGVYVPGTQQAEVQTSIEFDMDGGAFTVELAGAMLSAG